MRANFTFDDYDERMNQAEERGERLVVIKMPCCHQDLEIVAPRGDERWTSILVCPICNTVSEVVTSATSAWLTAPTHDVVRVFEEERA